MSRSRKYSGKKQPNKPTLVQEAKPQEQRRVPNILPGAVNFTPVNDKVMEAMYMQQAPQNDGTPFLAPGAPIRPIPALTPPQGLRQFAYLPGYNIGQLPRGTEDYTFEDLRALAKVFDGSQLCQQVWFDYISKLELLIEPRPELVDVDGDISEFASDIAFYQDFFAYPDKVLDLHTWMQAAVKDQLEIDAVAIYVRKDKIGRPYALDLVDGATIKPLIDDRGRRPMPPFPAYEQFINGMPAALLTSEDLLYVKETERTDSVYGLPRTQRIILKINQALRKQSKDLMRFTDGSIPAGVLQPSMDLNWSQEQLEMYEQQINNLLGGNDQARARIKVLPRGMEYKTTEEPDIHIDLDMWILNITAACHGLTMDELAITANSNRSVGQSQENVVYRRAMAPLMNRYAKLFTHILKVYFKETRFIIKWRGFEEQEDFAVKAGAYAGLVNSGIQSPTQAAREMGLPIYNDQEVPPFVMTKTGPMFLEDIADPAVRDLQKQAQLAGLNLAITSPGASPSKSSQDGSEGAQDEENDEQDTDENNAEKTPLNAKNRVNDSEYRRWRDMALNDLKFQRPIRQFQSDIIPGSTLAVGHVALQRCTTPTDVKAFFHSLKERAYA